MTQEFFIDPSAYKVPINHIDHMIANYTKCDDDGIPLLIQHFSFNAGNLAFEVDLFNGANLKFDLERVMSKFHIGSADHLDHAYAIISNFLSDNWEELYEDIFRRMQTDHLIPIQTNLFTPIQTNLFTPI